MNSSLLFSGLPAERPRHLFRASDIPALRAARAAELETLRRNVAQALADGFPSPPAFHRDPEALPYREYFGRFRDFCDRDLVACALGAWLLDDESERARAASHAKELFLRLCDWNPDGPCSLTGPWGDEVGLSFARVFPAAYDLLHPFLSEKERAYARGCVAAYAEQCRTRLLAGHYKEHPADSHSGRIPAYLGEAALALHGEPGVDEARLRDWLDLALDIYASVFPYYGGPDGAWAEGAFYSTSYTKWFLPFFSLADRCAAAAGSSESLFLSRPFYRNYARFLLEFALPDHENHPFGDGYWCHPDSPEWPGFFAQNPFRTYAALSGLPEAAALERALSAPPLFALHLLDVFLPDPAPRALPAPAAPGSLPDAVAFPDTGFASLHSDRANPASDLHVLARASKFGPGSHRHADQGSFALFFGGAALVSPSGYFGREYGTRHHVEWTRSSKAHNTLLVDGIGQGWKNARATGRVVSCDVRPPAGGCPQDGGCCSRAAVLDLSAAHPALASWTRTLRIANARTFILEDRVEAPEPVRLTSCLHTLSRPEADGALAAHLVRGGVRLDILPDPDSFASLVLSDAYDVGLNDGVPEAYRVSMPPQYHLYCETPPRRVHVLRTVFRIQGAAEARPQ